MGASCCNSNLSKEHEELIAAVGSTKKVMDDPQQFEDQEISEPKETIVDPIQLQSYEFEDHKPSPEYARPLTHEEELSHSINPNVSAVLKKFPQLVIRTKLTPNYKKIPNSPDPYKLLESDLIYVGQWKEGKPFGIGSLHYPNGDMYEGQVVDAVPHGEGRKIWNDGSYYNGFFVDGNLEGKGRFHRHDKFYYDGHWKCNKQHGKGIERWPNNTTYQGEYVEGKKQGRGRFTWGLNKKVKGDKTQMVQEQYDGEFHDNQFHGAGVYEWLDGRKYEGHWVNGKMEGRGTFTWPDGKKYEGEYKADNKHGDGQLIWPNDEMRLIGHWRMGKPTGQVKLLKDGKEYESIYDPDKKKTRWRRIGKFDSVSGVSHISQISGPNESKIIPNENIFPQEQRQMESDVTDRRIGFEQK